MSCSQLEQAVRSKLIQYMESALFGGAYFSSKKNNKLTLPEVDSIANNLQIL
jgi:hypothetical protein